jgi:protein-L-isoaspartate(D-aspartate) O-methyltransferase
MERWQRDCEDMIDTIRKLMRSTGLQTGVAELDARVEAAMRAVPRHRFVPLWQRRMAYADMALSIGHGQTISQPFIVALMSQLLELGGNERVLEIGTGCGYQTAVLAELAAEVFSVECVAELSHAAARQLDEMQLSGSVRLKIGNGWLGWAEHAPYDAVVITAAASRMPEPLLEQLAPGARVVLPVGEPGCTQMLTHCRVDGELLRHRPVLPVVFVPLLEHP